MAFKVGAKTIEQYQEFEGNSWNGACDWLGNKIILILFLPEANDQEITKNS